VTDGPYRPVELEVVPAEPDDPITPELRRELVRHQIKMERGQQHLEWAGLVGAFVLALAFLGVSAWLINGDHDAAGTIITSVDLVALVTVFVTGRVPIRGRRG
jgi:hypothetical protein